MSVVPIKPQSVRDADARSRFADHVQSVAFNLALSRRMIALLQWVRDSGQLEEAHQRGIGNTAHVLQNGASSGRPTGYADGFVSLAHAVERRGLVVWQERTGRAPEFLTQRAYKLSRAGELACEMCVEAGLMPAAQPIKKRAARK